MKRFIFILLASLLLNFMTACGSSPNEVESQNDQDVDETAEPDLKESSDDPKLDNVRSKIKNIIVNDRSAKKQKAILTESDNQNYALYLLDNYELTGEEPRKDVLYFKENDQFFMRIELLQKSQKMDEAIDTIKAQLEAVSSNVTEMEAPAGHDWLNNAVIYSSNHNKDQVNAYLVPRDDFLLKLTIFTNIEEDHVEPFLTMAETIEQN